MTALALCVRDSAAAFAVVADGNIIEVVRIRLTGARSAERMRAIARKARALATDYAARRIVFEQGKDDLMRDVLRVLPMCAPLTASLGEALHAVTGASRQVDALFPLVLRHPQLRNLVTILDGRNGIALSQRRRTVSLLAVALGLAVQERTGPRRPLFTH